MSSPPPPPLPSASSPASPQPYAVVAPLPALPPRPPGEPLFLFCVEATFLHLLLNAVLSLVAFNISHSNRCLFLTYDEESDALLRQVGFRTWTPIPRATVEHRLQAAGCHLNHRQRTGRMSAAEYDTYIRSVATGEVNRAAAWSALVRAGEAFFAVDSDVAFAEDPLAMLAGYSADIVLSGRQTNVGTFALMSLPHNRSAPHLDRYGYLNTALMRVRPTGAVQRLWPTVVAEQTNSLCQWAPGMVGLTNVLSSNASWQRHGSYRMRGTVANVTVETLAGPHYWEHCWKAHGKLYRRRGSGGVVHANCAAQATYGKAHTQDHKQHVLVESGLWFLRDDWREVPHNLSLADFLCRIDRRRSRCLPSARSPHPFPLPLPSPNTTRGA